MFNISKEKKIKIYNIRSERFGILTFNKSLFSEFKEIGYHVEFIYYENIVSLIVNLIKDLLKGNISIISFRQSLLSFINFRRCVLMLHGFPNFEDYNYVSHNLIYLVTKLGAFCSQSVVANSYLTKHINKKFFNIKSDYIWNEYLNYSVNEIDDSNYFKRGNNKNSKPRLLFVGRITAAKGINAIISGLSGIEQVFDKITFVGPIDKSVDIRLHKNICFAGPVNHSEVQEFYDHADIFISMNFFEPLGITYFEAIKNNLQVIIPKTAGAVDFLPRTDGVHVVCDDTTQEIQNALLKAVKKYQEH